MGAEVIVMLNVTCYHGTVINVIDPSTVPSLEKQSLQIVVVLTPQLRKERNDVLIW